MQDRQVSFVSLAIKTILVHIVTYFVMGLLASSLLDYETWYATDVLNCFVRQTSERIVMAGPMLQPIRGLLFALVFYLLRRCLFGRKDGWLVMWATLVVLGILNTFGPPPGSVEGMIYTKLPFAMHLRAWPEVAVQALLLSLGLSYWVARPEKKWLAWLFGGATALIYALLTMGLLLG